MELGLLVDDCDARVAVVGTVRDIGDLEVVATKTVGGDVGLVVLLAEGILCDFEVDDGVGSLPRIREIDPRKDIPEYFRVVSDCGDGTLSIRDAVELVSCFPRTDFHTMVGILREVGIKIESTDPPHTNELPGFPESEGNGVLWEDSCASNTD
jgi:hypothetical protein